MKKILLFICTFLALSCNKDDIAMKNLKEGYIWMDAGDVVHWDKHCSLIYKDVLLLKYIGELSYDYCACVPASNIEIIEIEAEQSRYLLEKKWRNSYILFINGVQQDVSISNFQTKGIYYYKSNYPEAKIRMIDIDRSEKCDIPLSYYDTAIKNHFRPCTVYDDLYLECELIDFEFDFE